MPPPPTCRQCSSPPTLPGIVLIRRVCCRTKLAHLSATLHLPNKDTPSPATASPPPPTGAGRDLLMTKKKHRNHGSHFGKASRPDTKVAVSSQDPGTENSAAAKVSQHRSRSALRPPCSSISLPLSPAQSGKDNRSGSCYGLALGRLSFRVSASFSLWLVETPPLVTHGVSPSLP